MRQTLKPFPDSSDRSGVNSRQVQTAPGKRGVEGAQAGVRVAAVVAALSTALDLSTGQKPGHAIRSCLLGMRIGRECGLEEAEIHALYFALLLKDCGCSSNASKTFHALGSDDLKAKRDVKTTDWTRVSWETLRYALDHVAPGKPFLERSVALFRLARNQKIHARDVTKMRCERGATLARLMGLPEITAAAIHDLDEHWDGSGNPDNLRGAQINLLSRIMLLAQTLENFAAASSQVTATEVIQQRSGKWFDPQLVQAALALDRSGKLWADINSPAVLERVLAEDQRQVKLEVEDNTLDSICVAFSQIVDAKSPFTYNHSNGVANASVAIARRLNLPRERIVFVRHAALLHDLGKLGVSNAILEKPAKLDDEEWTAMRRHPEDTWNILSAIPEFEELREVAASHHEKLNGTGYYRGMTAEHLSTESRIIAVADIFDALSAKRPYRDSLPLEKVFSIMRQDATHGIDGDCLRALEESGIASDQTYQDIWALNDQLASYNEKYS